MYHLLLLLVQINWMEKGQHRSVVRGLLVSILFLHLELSKIVSSSDISVRVLVELLDLFLVLVEP